MRSLRNEKAVQVVGSRRLGPTRVVRCSSSLVAKSDDSWTNGHGSGWLDTCLILLQCGGDTVVAG